MLIVSLHRDITHIKAVFFNSTSQSESPSISQPFKDMEDQILEYEDIKA
jgi:hypothetical protein